MQKTILVTGGSGFIGTKLTQALLDKGYAVVIADLGKPRIKHNNLSFIKLDVSQDTLPSAYDGKIQGIIHLAGKNIFGRWTESFKKGVYDSRIDSTRNLVDTISQWQVKPSVFVSASAFGIYGNKGDTVVDEHGGVGEDFLAHVCVDWEAESRKAEAFGIRTVQIRTAHVLGKGGLLAPLFVPFRFGLGAWIGKGNAWLPWVQIDDIVAIYIHALETESLTGPVNTAAPDTVHQKEFMKRFGSAMHKWVLFSIPIFVLKFAYGELALTFDNSVRMSSGKLIQSGFIFAYPELDDALNATLEKE
jgi:uncharacterized protein (TIGR01777 family)